MKLILQEVVELDHTTLEAGIIQVSCIYPVYRHHDGEQILCAKHPIFMYGS